MSMAQMLDIINVASVTITLPDIMRDVGYRVDQLQWVTSAYALAYGAFLLIGGRLGDLFGHRRIYILGVAWFSIWALVNGFAKDPIVMSVGRALQGMGAGFTIPSALAILTTTYPVGPERTHALALFGGSAAVGIVVGVLLGGVLGSTIGWHWIFFFTAILGFILAVLGFLVIPAEKNESTAEDRRVDIMGLTSFTLGIVAVIYYLSESPAKGWSSASTLAPLCVGIASMAAFVVIEWKIDYPIMPLHIWRSRRLVASCLTIVSLSAGINAMIFFTSLTFQNVQGYSPMKTSLCYVVNGIGAIITIAVVTKMVPYVRTKIIMVVGWLFFIASGILFAQIKADSSYWSIAFPALILNFLGMAPVWLCCQINSVADAKSEEQGLVGAVYNVALQVGIPLGVAISNVIANSRNAPDARGPQLLPGYQAAFYSYAVIGGMGLIITILLTPNHDRIRAQEDDISEIAAMAGGEDQSKIFEESKIGGSNNRVFV
ncbi:major facilitator superfamily domain-containing protein [Lobosporangium transversale]|uniref:Major facilitator superfamily domain-containing protein n=1 Tax=Lobosporangium transversale TaxID=64571 RepID=A0A1Y2GMC0_9FUNG|nr:major facilitator superfamily domain-containing protein [Lobosporangium transversale]ORZ13858.1 major facilitator superfamily domain-containing protein [Lobosporangium transversale]|eukprot:XP_021880642.1 major facilitator superfamily domain-containing protein [Lobosporangium transversale]